MASLKGKQRGRSLNPSRQSGRHQLSLAVWERLAVTTRSRYFGGPTSDFSNSRHVGTAVWFHPVVGGMQPPSPRAAAALQRMRWSSNWWAPVNALHRWTAPESVLDIRSFSVATAASGSCWSSFTGLVWKAKLWVLPSLVNDAILTVVRWTHDHEVSSIWCSDFLAFRARAYCWK